jgi:branched-chain amino acid transport system substrate-binding protein
MAKVVFEHMKANKSATVGFIGFSDSWGDLWVNAFKAQGEPMGLKMVAEERYGRGDTSVAGQALKLVAAKPDVVLVAASGAGSALPQIALRERGFKGTIYQTHGAVSKIFIKLAGKAAEGTILPSGPLVVAPLLPPSPQTSAALEHFKAYEAKYGAGSITQFSGHAFDVGQILKRIVPVALKSAKPGTQEFRNALLAAIESEKEIAASHGVYNYTPTDHAGLDERGRVLLTVKDGDWAVVK